MSSADFLSNIFLCSAYHSEALILINPLDAALSEDAQGGFGSQSWPNTEEAQIQMVLLLAVHRISSFYSVH